MPYQLCNQPLEAITVSVRVGECCFGLTDGLPFREKRSRTIARMHACQQAGGAGRCVVSLRNARAAYKEAQTRAVGSWRALPCTCLRYKYHTSRGTLRRRAICLTCCPTALCPCPPQPIDTRYPNALGCA